MFEYDKFVVLGFCVHAIESLYIFRLVDGIIRIEKILFPKDLHN